MSNQFIGLTMLVTLSSPPGAQLRGVVSRIDPGQSLTLRNVTCPSNGHFVPEFTIKAAEIVELVEAGNENAAPPPAATAIPVQHGHTPVTPKLQKLEDPAILSMGKRPAIRERPSLPSQEGGASMGRVESAQTTKDRDQRLRASIVQSPATLVDPMQKTKLETEKGPGPEAQILEELVAEEEVSEKPISKARRPRRRKGKKEETKEPNVTPAKDTVKSKGWRNTPLLEPNPSFQPFATLKRQKQRANGVGDENGWATEDATDVQDMGDFDFAGSLAKFDKHTVFNQIQAEDSVADEDRLVAQNRLPKAKPGTSGGKNLHYTENVLDIQSGTVKTKADLWKREAGDSDREERMSQRGSGSGRHSRRAERAESKLSLHRKPVSRKGSGIINGPPAPRALSQAPAQSSRPSFYLVPSDRRCEPISSLQMLSLENIADNELGLSEDMMAENAGRGIAEVALSALNATGGGLTKGKVNSVSNVVVFAGSNRSGIQSIASGRHLWNHGLNVIVCVLGLERESELLIALRRQIKVFRRFGGKVLTKAELLEHTKSLETSIDLIIDGLLGLTISFEELRMGDQATAYELIEWANRSDSPVLAVDVPTGIEPTSGKVNIIDGRRLYIHPKYVVAMGAPKKGLLEAMALGEGVPDEDGVGTGKQWQLFVADIGLGQAVWRKAGTRVRRGVEFEGSWVVGMRFQGGSE
ncbi:YjeF N-terminal domain-containing protein [Amylocarpus encephaloides]|uniref:Enhancer of mRNA-decapping protein 3 n=1 Tax=Amylocarpus encephaloides TaxID=45428 RepID=A0A9P7YNR3_9HELO|nr:YjeF N-terminal domain-containing protein [Amylocarpus encephaloides]